MKTALLCLAVLACALNWFIYRIGAKALVLYLKKNKIRLPSSEEFRDCVKEVMFKCS